jgi:hypothetical protein
MLYPRISEVGIVSKCNELLEGFNDFCHLTQLVTFTYFNKEINTRNIDILKTIEFNKYVLEKYKMLGNNVNRQIIDQWFIYKNNNITWEGNSTITLDKTTYFSGITRIYIFNLYKKYIK